MLFENLGGATAPAEIIRRSFKRSSVKAKDRDYYSPEGKIERLSWKLLREATEDDFNDRDDFE